MLINLYWGLFASGVIITLLSIVFSGLDSFDFDIDIDVGDIHLPLKPFTIMVFITIFGGIGVVASNFIGTILALIPAVGGGFIISKSLEYLLYDVLKRYETTTPNSNTFVGMSAVVIDTIQPNGIGKISVTVNGSTVTGLAKEINPGNGISVNEVVTIKQVEGSLYLVVQCGVESKSTTPVETESNSN